MSILVPGDRKRSKEGHTGYLLRQAHAGRKMRMENALKQTGLTLPQFSVMTMLAAYPGASGAALAGLSLLTPQKISVIVANLERDGMICRHPHKEHGRIQVIELTDSDHATLVRSTKAGKSSETDLLMGISPEDESIVSE